MNKVAISFVLFCGFIGTAVHAFNRRTGVLPNNNNNNQVISFRK